MNNPISSSAELIYAADSLIITAGAGMGVDSGLPDFRGKEGILECLSGPGQVTHQIYRYLRP